VSPSLRPEIEQQAIAVVRGLAMDAPLRASSGHQGTAMALAPLAHVLYGRVMRHDPSDPAWPDRDRFVLSNGHASILQYAYLFLAGYGLELDDLRAFRSWESRTPGHPERRHTPGIEVTTGPLGQGFGNSVGMAIAERRLRAQFGDDLVDHHIFCIAGDGCFMEGVSHEAAPLAGHLGLGRLVTIYDDNHVTIDGYTDLAYSDDVGQRFAAYGWHVEHLGDVGDDLDALEAGVRRGMAEEERPSLLILRSHIGTPSPDHTDDPAAHANPFTPEEVTRTKVVLGIPDEPFHAPDELVAAYREHAGARGREERAKWQARFDGWTGDRVAWDACWAGTGIAGWDAALPRFELGEKVATRQAVQKAIDASLATVPGVIAGAADLTGNTGVKLAGQDRQSPEHPDGRQVYYGIREHGMGAALVGMGAHGGVLPLGGTFFVFSDYLRPTLRLSSLSHVKCVFVFSHDSVGVGEDGPTHQPVEHVASLRAIPGLHVIRPADANETVEAWRAAVEHDGPTALILTRQGVPVVTDGSAIANGAGVVRDPAGGEVAQVILLGAGSEVAVCVEAAETLASEGVAARVVSMPSWDRFARADADVRGAVLPPGIPVLSVEAGTTFGWDRWADDAIGIERFGVSAPGDIVLTNLGINAGHVVERAKALLARGIVDQPS
jgi:transketolase